MDPNRKEELYKYEKNARIMYLVGFGLMPLSWLMCWIYASKRKAESEYLAKLANRCFFLFWGAIFIFGVWTAIYHAFWPEMAIIGYSIPTGEPE
ncbi:hypothetical protein M9Y10_022830 [Tritrichomonas musculus]|uniref:Gamma-secretase subunit PEN-2 n=1 Tax=Tritrichomonas musculus TaxID=1915356 RepID=A0ABR2KWR8_9EUKA